MSNFENDICLDWGELLGDRFWEDLRGLVSLWLKSTLSSLLLVCDEFLPMRVLISADSTKAVLPAKILSLPLIESLRSLFFWLSHIPPFETLGI